jgi:hypothetical protein
MADELTPEETSVPQEASGAPAGGGLGGLVAGQPDPGYTPAGVPTLEGVREKIETRYGTALGATELAQETPEGRAVAERYDAVQKAAARKLEEIRASMDKSD